MKPIKLIIEQGCDYVKVGMVLNEFRRELENPELIGEGEHLYDVQVDADIYRVKVDNQQRQIRFVVKAKRTFDEVFREVMNR